ncbi:MAG: GAF domain-containing protein [Chloroflexaceae bacterium]
MNQSLTTTTDHAPLDTARLVELTHATNLRDLAQRADSLLAEAFPDAASTLIWAEVAVSADIHDTLLARAHHDLTRSDEQHVEVSLPLQAAGQVIGRLIVRPGSLSPERERWLNLFAALLASSCLALRAGRSAALAQRQATLRERLHLLRGEGDTDALLKELTTLVQQVCGMPVVYWALPYRGSEWVEMRYLFTPDRAERPRLFWRIEAGLSSMAIKTGHAIETDNYLRACDELGVNPVIHPDLPPSYAWYALPLHDRGAVIGALVVFSDRPALCLAPTDREVLHWLAGEAAGIIQMALRHERALEEVRQRQALNQITRRLTSSLDPERVIALIVEQAPVLLDAEESSLLLLDEQTGELEFRYAAGPAGHRLLGQRLPAGKGVAGYVVSSGQPTIVNDTRSDGRFYRSLDGDSGFQTRSIMAVPLRGIDGVKGVIEVLNRHDNAPFVEDDRPLLEALADQAMIALENARRFASVDRALARRAQELDRSNERLRAILRASNMLRVEQQVDVLSNQIAEIVSASSGFRRVHVALVQQQRTAEPTLRFAAGAGSPPVAVSLAQFSRLLRSEHARGSLTYLIENGSGVGPGLWCPETSVSTAAPAPGTGRHEIWQNGDTLVCLLRNSRSELLGLLVLGDPEDGLRPSAEQVQILEILANQAASAIENAYLYAAQQHSLNRMMALNAFARALSTSLRSPQQILALTASGMQEMSGARWATVFLRHPAESTLERAFHTGAPCAVEAEAEELARQASLARRPLSRLPAPGQAGLLAVPLRGAGTTLGAICVGFEASLPDTGDVESLALFASQAASAIEGLHLLAQLRQGHDQLASIMASTREGMLLVNETGQVAVVNGAFYHLAAVEKWPPAPADLMGMPISRVLEQWQAAALFPPHESALLADGIAAVADGRDSFVSGQFNGIGPGARSLEWSVLRVTHQEQPERREVTASASGWPILLTVRDITAAKAAERLRQDLASMMVHDLRSPLTSIITSIDMILRGVVGDVAEKQREILAICFASAQNLLNLITMLLDISRLEDGAMPIELSDIEVVPLVQRAVETVSLIAQDKRITIETVCEPATPLVCADADLVLRVLQNLLDNAVKYNSYGERVLLRVGPYGPSLVHFSVKDHGVGIKESDLETIFAKFGQAANQRHKGSGLGLTFCKLVVETHGGRIWVESVPGKGSTFHFTLPVACQDRPA